jgi:hypothetical protein
LGSAGSAAAVAAALVEKLKENSGSRRQGRAADPSGGGPLPAGVMTPPVGAVVRIGVVPPAVRYFAD